MTGCCPARWVAPRLRGWRRSGIGGGAWYGMEFRGGRVCAGIFPACGRSTYKRPRPLLRTQTNTSEHISSSPLLKPSPSSPVSLFSALSLPRPCPLGRVVSSAYCCLFHKLSITMCEIEW